MSCGKIKTLKCLLLPHTIKKLTKSTELVNFICKLGHGASYTVIEELDIKNPYKMIEIQQQNKGILLDGVQEEVFMLVVTDITSLKKKKLCLVRIFHSLRAGANCFLMTVLNTSVILLC